MSELLRLVNGEPASLPRLLERAGLGLYRASPDGHLLWANAACLRLLGRDLDPATPLDLHGLFPPGAADADGSREVRLRRADGADVWVRVTQETTADGCEGVMEDITARAQAEEALRVLTRAVDTADLGVTVADPSGRILYTNPAEARMHGYEVEELIGRDVRVFAPQDLWKPMADERMREAGQWRRLSTNVDREGRPFPVQIASDVVHDEAGRPVALVSCSEDLTELRRVKEELLRGALYDGLTELPNRILFLDRLRHAVERAGRPGGSGVAVLFLDVDRFKVVNDSLGHQVGDELLQVIAQRLQGSLRPGDTAARFGGDEFTVLLEAVEGGAEATRAAERIQKALVAPVRVAGRDVVITVSVGIAVSGGGGEPQFLLRDANLALHRAKARGNGARQVFDEEMHAQAVALLQLETGLRRGMEREEFRVHFQPVVALDTGLLSGFEALVRWQDPNSGLVGPSDFVSVAEETGLIVPIDRWVLREACWQLVRWQKLYPSQAGLSVSVNLSSRQFAHPDLVSQVDAVLWETGLDPSQLRLEITESAIMENPTAAATALAQLKERGIGLLLDDFGTGYSSLSYLYRLPIDTIKVDRSFVSGTGQGGSRSDITGAIITLAHQLGMRVVAEGVETPAQLRWLRERGCELGQGYLFSPPLAEADARSLYSATAWLNRRREA